MNNKINLIITAYMYDGVEEFTFEIRGNNIYCSQVGFKSYDSAEKEGVVKQKRIYYEPVSLFTKGAI